MFDWNNLKKVLQNSKAKGEAANPVISSLLHIDNDLLTRSLMNDNLELKFNYSLRLVILPKENIIYSFNCASTLGDI